MVHWLGIEHTKIPDVGDAQDLVVITFDTYGPPTQPHVLNLACFLQRACSGGGCRPGLGEVIIDEDAVNKWPVFVPTGWPEWPVKGREQLISTDCG